MPFSPPSAAAPVITGIGYDRSPSSQAAQSTHPGLRHRQSPLYQQCVLVNHSAIRLPLPAPMTEHGDNRLGMAAGGAPNANMTGVPPGLIPAGRPS